ncbi:hypothetical protein AGMMS49965_08630 [Bacteroidia bacterium]|nr:hypothetical protein AGMMS49965_08630 [Bacteroidia bacterium]
MNRSPICQEKNKNQYLCKIAAKNLTDWYRNNLPKIQRGKDTQKRFETFNPHILHPIVVNRKFYDEIISKHKNDLLYFTKLEIAKQAHELIEKAIFARVEKSIHHPKAEFLVFKCDYQEFDIEFKVKKNSDGYFLHYMRITVKK